MRWRLPSHICAPRKRRGSESARRQKSNFRHGFTRMKKLGIRVSSVFNPRLNCSMQNAADSELGVEWLGRLAYADALALQDNIVAQKRADPTSLDRFLLLEHKPVYTIGRTPDQARDRKSVV